jgi:site-specific DNA-cytosine methylase
MDFLMGITVLSLCDGIAGARIALERSGIEVDTYYASEVKPHAIKCATENYPDIVPLGNVREVRYENGVLYSANGKFEVPHFDLVCFGSPCQSFSNAMAAEMRIGLEDDKKSGLFYECNRILQEVKPKYFFVENVSGMRDEDKDRLSEYLGCEPVRIDSQIVAPAMRKRYYWTNIPYTELTRNPQATLSSVLEYGYTDRKKARCLMANNPLEGYADSAKKFRRFYERGFSTMIYESEEHCKQCQELYEPYKKMRANMFEQITANDKELHDACDKVRMLTQLEMERCQTLPEGYTSMLNWDEALNVIGDGWTIDVICAFFRNIEC